MNALHLLQYVIRPTLERLNMGGAVAEALVLGTAITESRLTYLHQIGGPAIGLWQMEPETFRDILGNWLRFHEGDRDVVIALSAHTTVCWEDEMHGNLYLGAAMCRIHYRRVKEPLPPLNAHSLASYWKQYYNTPAGKGRVDVAEPHFAEAINAVLA